MAMNKTLTTKGVKDLNDEQVEEWSSGDRFAIAPAYQSMYFPNGAPDELTVLFIEWDEEDPNNFLLFYIHDGHIGGVHRMDVDRVEDSGYKTFDQLLAAVLTVLPDAEVHEDPFGQLVVHTGLQETEGGTLKPFEPNVEFEFPTE